MSWQGGGWGGGGGGGGGYYGRWVMSIMKMKITMIDG